MTNELFEVNIVLIMKALNFIARLFGFSKNSKYVDNHILEANVRSAIFMAFVIIVLEIWMVFRQLDKYLIPGWQNGTIPEGIAGLFQYTSTFFLFMFVGISVFFFSLTYRRSVFKDDTCFLINVIASAVTFLYCFGIFFENYAAWSNTRNILANVLLILLYVFAALCSITIFVDSLLRYKMKKNYPFVTVGVMVFFAFMCFSFGVKVSYSDYTSSGAKEIICFLTMILFGTCMIIWRPYVSIVLNVAIFVVFYVLIDQASLGAKAPGSVDVPFAWSDAADAYTQGYKDGYVNGFSFAQSFKDGDFVNYITFLIALTIISIFIYHQRRNEAIKDEELEYLANYDELTGLYNFSHFVRMVNEAGNHEGKILLFLNVTNFKTYNDQRGFERGNDFLRSVGNLATKHFPDAIICRQSDDHYLIYADFDGFAEKEAALDADVARIDGDIMPHLRVGGYRPRNGEDGRRASDKARFACSSLGRDLNARYAEYDEAMGASYHLMQYVIHNIDTAAAEGWVRPFYQPVVWSKNGELCGVEALARWVDPKRGLLPPGKFVPTLEATKLVHKLDTAILEAVCRDIRRCMDEGLPFVPVSINFSRLDFELMDAVSVLEGLVAKYGIPKDYLHVEITESALADDEGTLAKSILELKARGYALWLDDFGSGYSSLNVLKDFDFDVMKIDMKFLVGFENNEKAQPLIESVIAMAERLGMRTLTEGVETLQEKDFLAQANCERLQGYLFGKPLAFDDLQLRIKKGELLVSKDVM